MTTEPGRSPSFEYSHLPHLQWSVALLLVDVLPLLQQLIRNEPTRWYRLTLNRLDSFQVERQNDLSDLSCFHSLSRSA